MSGTFSFPVNKSHCQRVIVCLKVSMCHQNCGQTLQDFGGSLNLYFQNPHVRDSSSLSFMSICFTSIQKSLDSSD